MIRFANRDWGWQLLGVCCLLLLSASPALATGGSVHSIDVTCPLNGSNRTVNPPLGGTVYCDPEVSFGIGIGRSSAGSGPYDYYLSSPSNVTLTGLGYGAQYIGVGWPSLRGVGVWSARVDQSNWYSFTAAYTSPCTSITRTSGGDHLEDGHAGSNAVGFSVTPAGCAWTITNDSPSWMTVTSATSGVGNGQFTYSWVANIGVLNRQANIKVVAGGSYSSTYMNQNPLSCAFPIQPTSINATATGGAYSFTVTPTLSSCQMFLLSPGVSWLSGNFPFAVFGGPVVSGYRPGARR